MTKRTRLMLAFAALLLLAMYVFPLWKISLDAPQYPEGLGLRIMLDSIVGEKPNDLNNINNLNHYIGMKEIVPEAIPELTFMPWIIGALIAFGLLAAFSGKRYMLYAWVGVFFIVAVAGLVDFYLWEYDYGHNLNPEAAISIPGMSYQPPVIGSKKLLNFTASSWPATGGWMAILSLAIGMVLAIKTWRTPALTTLCLMGSMLLLTGCTPAPKPIAWGEVACAHCMMTIHDQRYAAELVTQKHKVYLFDAIECLAAFVEDERVEPGATHSLWVTDYARPGTLIDAQTAVFVQDAMFDSPMAAHLAAFQSRAEAPPASRPFRWAEVATRIGFN